MNTQKFKSNLYRLMFLFFMSMCTLIMVNCQNEELVSEQASVHLDTDITKINQLLEDLKPALESKAAKMTDDKVIVFEVVKNLKTQNITIENIQEVEFFPIAERTDYYNRESASFQVDCDLGNDEDNWSETCDGKWSCGKLINKCLKAGGCATICNKAIRAERLYASVQVTYLPVK